MSIQEYIRKRPEKDSFQTAMFIYESALIQMASRLEILNNELNHVYSYNPIEYIRTRLKTPESITKKLRKNGHNISIDDMVEHVHDIAGLRITCSFYSEIYFLADMIARQDNLKVVSIKDYISHPKESGYKSYDPLHTGSSGGRGGAYECGTADPYHGYGFLGQSGAQDIL